MKTKHTPGPWKVSETADENNNEIIVYEAGHEKGAGIASVSPLPFYSSESQRANAQLIAAAPELLEVCRDLLEIVEFEYANDPEPEDLTSWKRAIKAARALIAKAEGNA